MTSIHESVALEFWWHGGWYWNVARVNEVMARMPAERGSVGGRGTLMSQ